VRQEGRADRSPDRQAWMANRILIVEDDPDVAALLRLVMEFGGYVAETAHNLLTARAAITASGFPALLLLDRVLEDADGLDLCREVKAKRPGLPVVVVAALVAPARRVGYRRGGAHAWVVNRL
jgi:DNA-binding response OmpR family regulator